MKKQKFIGIIIILASVSVASIFAFTHLFATIPQEQSEPLYFQHILVDDNYNSTFSLDIKFTTEEADFFVREKIHVHVSLKRIHNNSILPFSSIFFALVTAEGHHMPFQSGPMIGWSVNKLHQDFYVLDYDTYLNFSAKYSCRLILLYVNNTNITNIKIEEDEVFVGPLLEVQPVSVALQMRWATLQTEATNKTIILALLVVILALITILIAWIDKYDSLVHEWNKLFHKKK